MKEALKEEITLSLSEHANEVSRDIGRFMYAKITNVQIASKNPKISSDNDLETIINGLQDIEKIDDSFYSFSVYNKDRLRIADSKRLSIGKKHTYSNYWKDLESGKNIVIDISRSESVGKVVMHFASRIKNNKNEYTGDVLVGRILINELFHLIGGFAEGGNAQSKKFKLNLINEEGFLLYSSSNPEKILVDKYDKLNIVNKVMRENEKFIESDGVLYFVSKKTGYKTYGNDWKLIITMPTSEVYTSIKFISKKMLLILIPIFITSILISLLLARLITDPISELSKAAKKIARGELNINIPTNYSGEVGVLSKQLSNTTKSLIGRIEDQKKSNFQLQKQKEKLLKQSEYIKEVSKEIQQSINYAEKIQRAALPPLATLQGVFPQSFVLFKPKDVIGGDFYWYETIRKGHSEYMIIAAADCTGHGVPGAIMSIMGSNQLTNIIYYQNYLDPKKIIARLDKNIKFELQREATSNETQRDGMEIAICVIDLDSLRMDFSGVGIPLRLIRKGDEEMTIYKTPKLMAGGMEGDERKVSESLIKETIQLEPGDKIYLSSDGYQDQFGGPKDKKFMKRAFDKMLEQTSKLSMIEQKNIIEKTFNDWKKDTNQTDDVSVIGFEVV